MSRKRWGAVVLGGIGLAGTAVVSIPPARHGVEAALHGLFTTHGWRVVTASPMPPREPDVARPGPREDVGAAEAPVTRKEVEAGAPGGPTLAQKDPDAAVVRQAVEAYRRGDLGAGDAMAARATGATARLAIQWAALRLLSHEVGLARIDAFLAAHPDWAAAGWLKRRAEEAVAATNDTDLVERRFAWEAPQTVAGKVALARAERAMGRFTHAVAMVRQVWREEDLSPFQERMIARDLGDLLGRDEHWIRAERLLYKEQTQAALGEAALAGPDVVLLAKARAAVIAKAASDAAIAAVPKALQNDPGLLFSRIQKARRANHVEEAAALLIAAPRDPARIVDGDEWWVERRLVARKLLDAGDTRQAYRICAEHAASSTAFRIEAEFHAGWIALRFLDDPSLAMGHFTRAAAIAETPMSKGRAAFWQGRAAEALKHEDEARAYFLAAARQPANFYGQLAAAKLGLEGEPPRMPIPPARGDERGEAVAVAEFLFSLGARDIALPLALDVARYEPSEARVGAMAEVIEQARDAPATLALGKAATQRGLALEEAAFPTFGIPRFEPLKASADLAIVYAIARQESEFDPHALSPVGARGLMQIIPATAKETAERNGVAYDEARLSGDAAFNAQLGSAYLAALLDQQGGSTILTFAAYNAGGKNVRDWIAAYGDPRKPGVDPIDWIERIPFTETRNYVQRVTENLQVYRSRLGRPGPTLVGVNAAPPGGGT